MRKLRIIVSGFIGLYPTGGVTWDYIQYVLGLKQLGHDVYYIEDTGQYATYRISERAWDDPYDTVNYLKSVMESFGLADRWAYRCTYSRKCYGLSTGQVKEICSTADVFINVSAASVMRNEYQRIPARVLIDSDPMFTQLQSFEEPTGNGDPNYATTPFTFNDYTHYFTFGENIGSPDCLIPQHGFKWQTTRQPICIQLWRNELTTPPKFAFTTVMNWSVRSKLEYGGKSYGQKDVEFIKFADLPALFGDAEFNINLAVSKKAENPPDKSQLQASGWKISEPGKTIATPDAYRSYIQNSAAEFSVAKETYVSSNSGWFSCRSACYLAATRPVVTQETAWSKYIPSGQGVIAFTDKASALDAVREIFGNYDLHSRRALEIAGDYFDSNMVLNKLINGL